MGVSVIVEVDVSLPTFGGGRAPKGAELGRGDATVDRKI